ncbi:MAG: dipeptidase [Spirochaetota bacterium]
MVIDSHNDTIVAHIRRGYLSPFDEAGGDPFDPQRARYRLLSGEEPVGTIGLVDGPESPRGEAATIQINVPKMLRAGIDLAFFAIDVTLALGNHLAYAADGFGWFFDELDRHPGQATVVRSVADIVRASDAGRPAALLAVEHADGAEGSLHVLRSLFEIGVRSIGLTHNRSSRAADGCGEAREGVGLTRFGEELVAEMNRLGMLVDLAHASRSAFFHAIEVSQKPVIFSHGNARALCDHRRNLDDEQLVALAGCGGVIGVSFVPFFIDADNPTFERLLDHVDHIRDVAGIDTVGIGSDFDGGGSLLRDAGEFRRIEAGLRERGYTDEEIRKVMGENTLRVLREVLPEEHGAHHA